MKMSMNVIGYDKKGLVVREAGKYFHIVGKGLNIDLINENLIKQGHSPLKECRIGKGSYKKRRERYSERYERGEDVREEVCVSDNAPRDEEDGDCEEANAS